MQIDLTIKLFSFSLFRIIISIHINIKNGEYEIGNTESEQYMQIRHQGFFFNGWERMKANKNNLRN